MKVFFSDSPNERDEAVHLGDGKRARRDRNCSPRQGLRSTAQETTGYFFYENALTMTMFNLY